MGAAGRWRPAWFAKQPNEGVLAMLAGYRSGSDVLVIERIASYGMAVGAEVFETVYWSGRFPRRLAAG